MSDKQLYVIEHDDIRIYRWITPDHAADIPGAVLYDSKLHTPKNRAHRPQTK